MVGKRKGKSILINSFKSAKIGFHHQQCFLLYQNINRAKYIKKLKTRWRKCQILGGVSNNFKHKLVCIYII